MQIQNILDASRFTLRSKISSLTLRHVTPLGLLVPLFLSACGASVEDGYDRQRISGTVIVNGIPMESGTITFLPETRSPVVSGTIVKDGEFAIEEAKSLPPGIYKVSISSIEGPDADADLDAIMASPPQNTELIPEIYNSKTTLTCEVREGDENVFHFELQSK